MSVYDTVKHYILSNVTISRNARKAVMGYLRDEYIRVDTKEDEQDKFRKIRGLVEFMAINYYQREDFSLPNSIEELENRFFEKYTTILSDLGIFKDSLEIRNLNILLKKSKLVKFGLYSENMSELDIDIVINIKAPAFIGYYLSEECSSREK